MARRLLMLAVIFVILAPLFSPAYALTGNPMPIVPTLTISALDPPVIYVSVDSDSVHSAQFHANVSVDKPPLVGTVVVSFEASTKNGFPTTTTPQQISFKNSGTAEITVTVVVPTASAGPSITSTIVNGLATFPGGSTSASSSATIKISQFFRCALNATPKLGIDNPQVYKLMIKNSGNGNDSFSLSILNSGALSKVGLTLEFETIKTQKIPQDEAQMVNLTVSYNPTAASGKKDFYVRATSDGSKSAGNDSVFVDILLTIDVRPLSGPQGMSIGLMAGAIIVAVGVTLFVAKKKGKLRLGKKAKDVPKEKTTKEK